MSFPGKLDDPVKSIRKVREKCLDDNHLYGLFKKDFCKDERNDNLNTDESFIIRAGSIEFFSFE